MTIRHSANIDPLIDITDLAALLGCHQVTLYRRIQTDPKLAAIMLKVGSRWKTRLSAANQYIDGQTTAAQLQHEST